MNSEKKANCSVCGQKRRAGLWRGFTLIELLVVISIIAILMAIMVPALRRARQQAISLTCKTRLKDIGSAFMMYTADNKDMLPTNFEVENNRWGRWFTKVAPYYDQVMAELNRNQGWSTVDMYEEVFRCPTQQKFNGIPTAAGTYGYNNYFTGTNLNNNRIAGIRASADVPLLADIMGEGYMGLGPAWDPDFSGSSNQVYGGMRLSPAAPHPLAFKYGYMGGRASFGVKWNIQGPAPVHNGQCNFVFADFHIEDRNVCDENAWPWFGKWDGSAFHPTRTP